MKKLLKEYAILAVKTGINIQKDRKLFINAPIHAAEFVRIVTKTAYEEGAKKVIVNWLDDEIALTSFKYESLETIGEFPEWTVKQMNDLADEKCSFLHIISPDPELLKDVAPEKIALSNKTKNIALKEFRERSMKNENPWSIVAVPNEAWAKKVYSDLPTDEAVERLWDAILSASRVEDGKSIENWKKHNANLKEKSSLLNEKKFDRIHYKSEKTDLMVEMSPKQVWHAGRDATPEGIEFNPNIPTEEVFSMPKATGVNGTLASTMPLNYGGNLIDNFILEFKDGKVVDFTAEKGYDILKGLLDTDEGARHLGEIALVPVDSPISNTKTVYYNTLFDENASCHFAFGMAYKSCIENGDTMNEEELKENDVNGSIVHVDFMVGSKDLNITGIDKEGNKTPIFINGNWAI